MNLWALLIKKAQLDQWKRAISRIIHKVYREAKTPWTWAILLLLYLLAALLTGSWRAAVNNVLALIKGFNLYLGVFSVLVPIYAMLWTIYRSLRGRTSSIDLATKEWVIGDFFVYLAWPGYAVVYMVCIWPNVWHDRGYFLSGFLKDSFIYTFLAAFLVSGMYRFGECVPALKGPSARDTFKTFAHYAVLIALVCLTFDVIVAGLPNVFLRPEYTPNQIEIIRPHIYVRDFLLLATLAVAIFTRLFRQVISAEGQH